MSRTRADNHVRRALAVLSAVLGVTLTLSAQAAPLELSAYRGKVVLLDFWASWCNPCRQSFPWMGTIAQEYAAQGLVVVAVNVDRERALADDFLHDNPAQFKIVYDPQGEVARQFQFKDMPTSYLIDRTGHIRFVHPGFYRERAGEYLSQIRTLLDEPAH
jgi:cytochrome c biogenesis protein CcmG, thiol:disulfide interchange protein DsbE